MLRKKEKPTAEVFSVSYVADGGDADRPVTFVFNGGPGASSAYLHMGAVGPQRVDFPADGTVPKLPLRLVAERGVVARVHRPRLRRPGRDGLQPHHRAGRRRARRRRRSDERRSKEYFGDKRDLESLCEVIGRWLSGNGRWGSPVFIAGESYGGYRVGRLVRMLQETAGIGLNGAILISPALEPGLALGATTTSSAGSTAADDGRRRRHHGRSRAFTRDAARGGPARGGDVRDRRLRGVPDPRRRDAGEERERVLARLADLVGLPSTSSPAPRAGSAIHGFVRELLRDERKVLGLYDATITATDPFPDREPFAGPTRRCQARPAYTMAVNRQLRPRSASRRTASTSCSATRSTTPGRTTRSSTTFARRRAPRRLPLRDGDEPAHEGVHHARAVRPRHAVLASDRLRNLMRLDPRWRTD